MSINDLPYDALTCLLPLVYDPVQSPEASLVCKEWNEICNTITRVYLSQIVPTSSDDPKNTRARKIFLTNARLLRHLKPDQALPLAHYPGMISQIKSEERTWSIHMIRSGEGGDDFLEANGHLSRIEDLVQVIVSSMELTGIRLVRIGVPMVPTPMIEVLKSCETINFEGNRIKYLPEEFWGLTKLTRLNLSHNMLNELPEEIGRLTNLERLDLANLGLCQLPLELSSLGKLRTLEVNRNQFMEVPQVLEKMPELTRVNLDDNPIQLQTNLLE
ncbi:MAG: leucine-rich repeat domain-containing protein [Simkaniaceae bacterium]|nr:leucine-rich repeat domain-containing protein [Simkaniaceae bacterium]